MSGKSWLSFGWALLDSLLILLWDFDEIFLGLEGIIEGRVLVDVVKWATEEDSELRFDIFRLMFPLC